MRQAQASRVIRLRGERASAEVRRFVAWLQTVIDVRHRVDVHLTSRLFGYFDAPGRATGFEPYIIVQKDQAVSTIAHEIVHYEQWRDKRPTTERGVEQRAQALVRRWRREAA